MGVLKFRFLVGVLVIALLGAACGDDDVSASSSTPPPAEQPDDVGGEADESRELTKVTLALPWYPIPEFGGAFAALHQGYFEEVGIDLEIIPGSPQTSVTQMVGVGHADLAFGNTDNTLVLARQEGVPLKAIATTFQRYPGSAVYHLENPVATPADLSGRNFYSVPGQFDTDWLVDTFDLDINQNPYSPPAFFADSDGVLVTWSFNIAAALDAQGLEWDTVHIADTGWNPYALVLMTSDSFLEQNRELLVDFLDALNRGWDYYRENVTEINQFMYDFDDSKSMTLEGMEQTARLQEDFYVMDGQPFSAIDPERFEQRLEEMRETGLLRDENLTIDDVLDLTLNPAQPG